VVGNLIAFVDVVVLAPVGRQFPVDAYFGSLVLILQKGS
jgi:hypothetical protein